VRESIRLPWTEQPYFTPGFPLALPLEHAARVSSFNGPPTGTFESGPAGLIRSDTGELAWRCSGQGSGSVTVDAPRSQALIGYDRGQQATKNLEVELSTPFSAITLSSLDKQPIADASQLWLTATARVAHSGMEWNGQRTSLTAWGKAPTRIEPVTGQAVLKNLRGAKSVSVQSLDGAGRPLGEAILAEQRDPGWTFRLGKPATTWFVVAVGRE
jgi:hypothetical protein